MNFLGNAVWESESVCSLSKVFPDNELIICNRHLNFIVISTCKFITDKNLYCSKHWSLTQTRILGKALKVYYTNFFRHNAHFSFIRICFVELSRPISYALSILKYFIHNILFSGDQILLMLFTDVTWGHSQDNLILQ